MKKIIAFLLMVLISINCNGITVSSGGAVTGDGTGDVLGPATHSASYVPQWNGVANSKTLVAGFPIETVGKSLVNQSSTANMLNYLSVPYHNLITVESGGTTTFSDTIKVNTIQAKTSGGIFFRCSNGTKAAIVDGGGSCSLSTSCLLATTNVMTKKVYAYTSAGLAITDDSAVTANGIFIKDGGNISIGTLLPERKFNVSGNMGVTGNLYVTGTIYKNSLPVVTTKHFSFGIDGGDSTPTTGNLNATYISPTTCTITKWFISSDVTGNAVLDIKRDGVSIIGAGNKPTLSSASKNSATVSSWTSAAITEGDRLTFVLDSVATLKAATVVIKFTE